jgi:hypothetical protein
MRSLLTTLKALDTSVKGRKLDELELARGKE